MTSRSDSEVIGIDDEVAMIVDGVLAFYRGAIVPIEERNAERLGNPRRVYDEDGRPTKEWVEIRREARRASAAAGYCAMFAPIEVGGGGGQGAVVSFLLYVALFREFGPGGSCSRTPRANGTVARARSSGTYHRPSGNPWAMSSCRGSRSSASRSPNRTPAPTHGPSPHAPSGRPEGGSSMA